MIFSMPFQIPGQNKRERWHWAKQRREVKCATFLVSLMMAHKRIAKATGPRIVKITSYRRQRFADNANLVGGCKGLIDGMVAAGLLLDDKDKVARFEYAQQIMSQMPDSLREEQHGKPCTVIEITDQSPATPVATQP